MIIRKNITVKHGDVYGISICQKKNTCARLKAVLIKVTITSRKQSKNGYALYFGEGVYGPKRIADCNVE